MASHNTSVTDGQTDGQTYTTDRRQSCYRRLQHSCSVSKSGLLFWDTVYIVTDPKLEDSADRLVVADTQAGMTSIRQLPDVFTRPQNTITPSWSSTLVTETSIYATVHRYEFNAISILKAKVSWHRGHKAVATIFSPQAVLEIERQSLFFRN